MLEGIKGVSTYATDVDSAFMVVFVITLFLFIVTIGSMLWFIYRYRASKHSKEQTKNIKHYTPIEVAWTVIPTILMMIVFYFGLDSLRVQRTMPSDENSLNINVLAQRWSWSFEYENGKRSPELYIPVNTNIKLTMTAPVDDVIHSFYVPAFRAKEDVLPGRFTQIWFNANQVGKYDIQCAEYCGTRHSYMRSFVHVLPKEEYTAWITPKKEPEQKDAMELMSQYGCVGCHSFDGSVLVGPTLKDIYNKEVTVIKDGKSITLKRDEMYLKNSILNSNLEIVEGFSHNLMPQFKGVIPDDEVTTIIEFLKGEEKPKTKPKLDGATIIQNNGCISCHSTDGTKIVGPSFKGIYQRVTKVTKDGKSIEVIADENYLKNSILNPKQEVVEGYPNIMPPFNVILKEEEINAIIEYLKTLK